MLFSLLLLSTAAGASAQTAPCCHSDAITGFAALANREDFRLSHLDPLPYHYEGAEGTPLIFKTPDGQDAHGFLFKAKSASNKYLFVYHEWYGLNDYVKKESEKLYNDLESKVNVLALDMYDQQVAANRQDAAKLMQAAKPERLKAIMQGALQYAGSNAKIATIGWCYGGGLSLQSGLLNGTQNVGDVMYYGMPEKDVEKLKTLRAPVLGIFGTKDKGINPQIVAEFEKNMQAAGRPLTVKSFDAEHGFANPSNPIYNSEATKEAYKLAIAFLRKQLL